MGLIKTVLLNAVRQLVSRKEAEMFGQVKIVMERLRLFAKGAKANNKKIDGWVDEYIERCAIEAKPVVILTQWCMSKDFEVRYRDQGNRFVATSAEIELVKKEIPRILSTFESSGMAVSWWITFNRSYLDSGRMEPEIESQYKAMIKTLFTQANLEGKVMILDWEDDVLMKRPGPNRQALRDLRTMLSENALQIVFDQHAAWARNEAGLQQTDEELWRDVEFQIACEAEEGRVLCNPKESPFENGEFILVPLEVAERYNPTFLLLDPDFEKRIASILKPYPWRWKEDLQ